MSEADGHAKEYVGGYSDWVKQGRELADTENIVTAETRKRESAERRKNKSETRLSYKDQRELELLPAETDALAVSIAALQAAVAAKDFCFRPSAAMQNALQELGAKDAELEQRVERWGELETAKAALR